MHAYIHTYRQTFIHIYMHACIHDTHTHMHIHICENILPLKRQLWRMHMSSYMYFCMSSLIFTGTPMTLRNDGFQCTHLVLYLFLFSSFYLLGHDLLYLFASEGKQPTRRRCSSKVRTHGVCATSCKLTGARVRRQASNAICI